MLQHHCFELCSQAQNILFQPGTPVLGGFLILFLLLFPFLCDLQDVSLALVCQIFHADFEVFDLFVLAVNLDQKARGIPLGNAPEA